MPFANMKIILAAMCLFVCTITAPVVFEKNGHTRASPPLNCKYGTDILGPKSCNDNISYLARLDGADCCVNGGMGTCVRVACSHTCGNFLCNKTNGQFCASCGDVATNLQYIKGDCEHVKGDTAGGARDFDTHFVGQKGTNSC
ncbi:hypothetical protein G6011_02455 [Alternaria panax]|uniref:Uncharacterized protein n=1 Tax=Alternaria panax TaxID=48097 RepID=A0AAD4I7D9_9PLEO|nr:hypothetical protein G6011_02455 [Alternaria panax]